MPKDKYSPQVSSYIQLGENPHQTETQALIEMNFRMDYKTRADK